MNLFIRAPSNYRDTIVRITRRDETIPRGRRTRFRAFDGAKDRMRQTRPLRMNRNLVQRERTYLIFATLRRGLIQRRAMHNKRREVVLLLLVFQV